MDERMKKMEEQTENLDGQKDSGYINKLNNWKGKSLGWNLWMDEMDEGMDGWMDYMDDIERNLKKDGLLDG